jgi:Glycoside hydrolase family 5 C-terminal domain
VPSEPDSTPGFRAAEAYIRPSAIYTTGDVLKHDFDLKNCTFTLSLNTENPSTRDAPTEIYLPEFHFPTSDTVVAVSGGKWAIEFQEEASGSVQVLKWWHGEGDQDIKIQGVKRKAGEAAVGHEDDSYLEHCQRNCAVM